jgi:hypothetical protein
MNPAHPSGHVNNPPILDHLNRGPPKCEKETFLPFASVGFVFYLLIERVQKRGFLKGLYAAAVLTRCYHSFLSAVLQRSRTRPAGLQKRERISPACKSFQTT